MSTDAPAERVDLTTQHAQYLLDLYEGREVEIRASISGHEIGIDATLSMAEMCGTLNSTIGLYIEAKGLHLAIHDDPKGAWLEGTTFVMALSTGDVRITPKWVAGPGA